MVMMKFPCNGYTKNGDHYKYGIHDVPFEKFEGYGEPLTKTKQPVIIRDEYTAAEIESMDKSQQVDILKTVYDMTNINGKTVTQTKAEDRVAAIIKAQSEVKVLKASGITKIDGIPVSMMDPAKRREAVEALDAQ